MRWGVLGCREVWAGNERLARSASRGGMGRRWGAAGHGGREGCGWGRWEGRSPERAAHVVAASGRSTRGERRVRGWLRGHVRHAETTFAIGNVREEGSRHNGRVPAGGLPRDLRGRRGGEPATMGGFQWVDGLRLPEGEERPRHAIGGRTG